MEIADKVMKTKSPKEAKRLGREIKNFNDFTWNNNKEVIYFDVIKAKFTDERNKDIRQKLIDTGDSILVECSPYDRIWGIGYSKNSPEFINKKINEWGQNLLGKILMRVRDKIK